MTEDKNTTIISGFSFSDPATIELARKEESAVTYLKGQIDYQKPDAVLSMYQKLVHQKVFRTAVGMTFLHEVQDQLLKRPQIPDTLVDPIYADPFVPDGSKLLTGRDQKIRDTVREDATKYRDKYRAALVVCGIFLATIIALVVIGMTSNMTTVINYRSKIENEYATWEQDLKTREQQVRDRENQLLNGEDQNLGQDTGGR